MIKEDGVGGDDPWWDRIKEKASVFLKPTTNLRIVSDSSKIVKKNLSE